MSTKYVNDTGLGTISDIVSERLATKVEAETGKGLSEANFTPVEKSLLATINSSGYITPSQKGAANGIASLGADGKVPSNQLPEGDIVKGYYDTTSQKFYKESSYTTEIIGQNDKLYIDLATPKNYRWNGTAFVESSATLTLGSVEGTAYPGNLGANNATKITQLNTSIGNLGNLETTEKSSLVGAINEVNELSIPMLGASTSNSGHAGYVPTPNAGDNNKYLRGDGLWISIIDYIYPIGSIYMSVNSIEPSVLFGGTWEQLKDRFLLSAGDTYSAGTTGGEATHELTINEMPSHDHWIRGIQSSVAEGSSYFRPRGYNETGNEKEYMTSPTGGSKAHNNMPPYLTVYMWKRTA